MPVSINFTPHGPGVVLVATGVVVVAEVLEEVALFLRDRPQEFAAARYWFGDFSAMDSGELVVSDVKRLAELSIDAARANRGLLVAVCAPGDLEFAAARMWAALVRVAGWRVEVLRDRGSALSCIQEQLGETL